MRFPSGGLSALAACLALACCHAAAQENLPKFEVASVKPSKKGNLNMPRVSPGRISFDNVSLFHLIEMAYAVEGYQIHGAPTWVHTDGFEIAAKAENGASPTRMLLMIRALIEDRFRLKVYRETVQGSVYNLELAKGGHRMHVAAPGSCVDIDSARGSPLPLCDIRQREEEGTHKLVATGEAMALFAGYLSWQLRLPVVDKTGLPGKYDFELKFVPDDLTPGIDGSRDGDRPLGPSLFEAVSQQLGLKLKASKGPVEHLVIDRVARPEDN